MTATTVVVLLVAAAACWIGTGWMRRYAQSRLVLDIPNTRSLHIHPTPRGGGAAIVVVTLAGVLLMGKLSLVPASLVLALTIGSGAVALVGWMDDRRGISALVRATVHLAAAVWFLVAAGLDLSPAAFGLAVFWIAWSTNLYNFMDGIDGLAGIEAVSVGAALGFMLLAAGWGDLALLPWLMSAAGLGFLRWNWPPAKVFMGDVGSGFLGFLFGAMTIVADRWGAVPAVISVMLLGVFVFDATVTLLRRIARGERWYQPHRNHAYQRLIQAGIPVPTVAMMALLLNLGFAVLGWIALANPRLLTVCILTELVALLLIYLAAERLRPMVAGTRS
jgi:Fuc2NAc and GlcNAc transferase